MHTNFLFFFTAPKDIKKILKVCVCEVTGRSRLKKIKKKKKRQAHSQRVLSLGELVIGARRHLKNRERENRRKKN
jgi:hypothetical protein